MALDRSILEAELTVKHVAGAETADHCARAAWISCIAMVGPNYNHQSPNQRLVKPPVVREGYLFGVH
jgi:hypothetical protein